MELNDILQQLNEIFKDILDLDTLVLTPETTARDVEEWDSLSHIQIIVAAEKHFKIRLTAQEIQALENVGDMCKLVQKKSAQ
ncbi:MAG: acyl carrier protein [Bacteroidetes bacterium HGW-Bacteroidetes-21]|jgi:acyl carrier protein|nr:MAG: acyl carrier protein [Bacteroidetes bacterium HGW-Bacteroidetes-21]